MNILESERFRSALSPRSLVRALWKRKLLVLSIALLGTAASVFVVHQLHAVYEAQAEILVESQKIPENFVAPTVQTPLEARLDNLKHQVLSDERLWSLIQELNLYANKRMTKTRGEVLDVMRQDILISLERGWSANGPGAFRVSYQAPTAKLAMDVCNRIGSFFITENLKEREQEANVTSQFLDSQLQDAKRKLQEQESRLRDFKESHNGELPEQENGLLAATGQSKAELLGIQDALSRAQQNKLILESSLSTAEQSLKTLQELSREHAAVSVSVPSKAPAASQPRPLTRLEQDRAELAALRLRYEDKHPDIQRLLFEVAELEKNQKQNRAAAAREDAAVSANAGPPRNLQPSEKAPATEGELVAQERIETVKAQMIVAQHEIERLEERRDRVLQDVAETQSRIQRLPIREQELVSLTRDYETRKAEYQALLNKKMAADVAANMERWQKAERFVMLNEPHLPEKPIRPKRTLLMLAGAILSLLAAAAIGILLEIRTDVFLGEWELAPGTIVLGRVPHMTMDGGHPATAKSVNVPITPAEREVRAYVSS